MLNEWRLLTAIVSKAVILQSARIGVRLRPVRALLRSFPNMAAVLESGR
jgi:hypothetical protein